MKSSFLLIPKVYFDSNVYFSVEDKQLSNFAKYIFSLLFNQKIKGAFSSTVMLEVEKNHSLPYRYLNKCFPLMDFYPSDDRVIQLAYSYIEAEILPRNKILTAMHIATATIHRSDYFVSWDYQNIVNIKSKRQFNGQNNLMGYLPLKICTPPEINF